MRTSARLSRTVFSCLALFVLTGGDGKADVANDKVAHAVAGTVIYGVCIGFGALTDIDWINYKTCLIPVGVAAVGKEIYDNNYGGTPEAADAVATMAVPLLAAGITFTLHSW